MGSDQRSLLGTSQEVQWLRLQASNAGGTGSAPGQGTKIPHAAQCKDKKKFKYIKKKINKFSGLQVEDISQATTRPPGPRLCLL